jgi:nitrite reductase/ring-hydroxylating ferredoxin subunit
VLSKDDNDLMCQVGPGTPMGNMMRQYWIPALIPQELPAPDGPPIRLRLLGENLIAFRVTSGAVGIITNACPHRGASMFFGRNEEEGLRCVYHGWKFDVSGACIDMPSEPAESNFKSKVRTRAYPTIERNGIIWTYMGPRETAPPLPELPPNLDENCRVTKRLEQCNYMQALEGDIDTVHFGFLHAGHVNAERDGVRGSADYYATKTRDARIESYDHEIGSTYAAVRPAEAETDYWRTGHFLMPFYTMNAPGVLPLKNSANAWVPLDDENTMVWGFGLNLLNPEAYGIGGLKVGRSPMLNDPQGRFDPYISRSQQFSQQQASGGRFMQQFQPETTDWLGRFRPLANKDNDYLIDRDLMKMELDPSKPQTGTYTGLPGPAQDPMAQETMGAIYDRTQEHLGTTDSLIIRTRRKLINAAKAFQATGAMPPGVDNPSLYRMRSGGALLPKGVMGLDVLRPVHFLQSDSIEESVQVPAGGGGGA